MKLYVLDHKYNFCNYLNVVDLITSTDWPLGKVHGNITH